MSSVPGNNNSHPIHPAMVHFPIAFISLACALDILFAASTSKTTSILVTNIYDVTPFIGDISRAAFFANVLGVLTAIPAVASGIPELLGMTDKMGIHMTVKDKNGKVVSKRLVPKVKAGITHALMSEFAVAVSAYKWWTRRKNPAFVPDTKSLWLSAIVLPAILTTAYIGGSLVYKMGVGVTKQARPAKGKAN